MLATVQISNELKIDSKRLSFISQIESGSTEFIELVNTITLKLCGILFKDVHLKNRPKVRCVATVVNGSFAPNEKRIIYPTGWLEYQFYFACQLIVWPKIHSKRFVDVAAFGQILHLIIAKHAAVKSVNQFILKGVHQIYPNRKSTFQKTRLKWFYERNEWLKVKKMCLLFVALTHHRQCQVQVPVAIGS